jgi:alpha/beta superfamily hydrolase
MQSTVLVELGNDIALECMIIECSSEASIDLCIVFHPWAWLGGCMADLNVHRLCSTAVSSQLFQKVVSYNVRGTGRSTGWKSWGYATDGHDAHLLIQEMLSTNQVSSVCLIGYSYGSLVAAECLQLLSRPDLSGRPSCVGLISVGFPLGGLSRLFLSSGECWAQLISLLASRDLVPFLLVLGDQDQFTSVQTAETLFKAAAGSIFSNKMQLQVIPSCDHFFNREQTGRKLKDICHKWLLSHLST